VAPPHCRSTIASLPHTGRKTWDANTVRAWHSTRPGQGARTDLTYLPTPDGYPVFINPTTITTVALLRDLASTDGARVTKSALRQQWAQQFADDKQIPLLPQPQTPRPHDNSKKRSTPCTNSAPSTTTVTTSPSPTTPSSLGSQTLIRADDRETSEKFGPAYCYQSKPSAPDQSIQKPSDHANKNGYGAHPPRPDAVFALDGPSASGCGGICITPATCRCSSEPTPLRMSVVLCYLVPEKARGWDSRSAIRLRLAVH
jgi:hypothetical protein